MKNNKGMTIVEILISVCIIALVLTLLFALLIQVRNEENNNSIQSNFLMNQSTFIKQIEEDIVNYGVKAITPCEIGAAGDTNITISKGHENDFKCIKLHFAADYIQDNIGILLIYNSYKKYDSVDGQLVGREPTWTISYQRGYYRQCGVNNQPDTSKWQRVGGILAKELPTEIDLTDIPYVLYTATGGYNAASLVVPIENLEGEHYDLNISITFQGLLDVKGDPKFICSSDPNRLECKCSSSDNQCKYTLVQANNTGTLTEEEAKSIQKIKEHMCPIV